MSRRACLSLISSGSQLLGMHFVQKRVGDSGGGRLFSRQPPPTCSSISVDSGGTLLACSLMSVDCGGTLLARSSSLE
jgi:hypothetical protein